jgi:Zn-dependent peptidase ImmA (M78 family)/transcriptional regulator with XRE-family HTH domain
MPLDQRMLGTKLKRYREQFDLTLAEVSRATGISEPVLDRYEQGLATPSGDEILIFADFYKCDFKFFISNEKLAPFEETATLFRRYGNDFSKRDRWAVQEFLFLAECEHFLQDELHRLPKTSFTYRKTASAGKQHGPEAASSLRRYLGYSDFEVRLDIYRDLRATGIHVFRRKLQNSNISGLYVRHPVAGDCILINYNEDIYRQRFTAAHEAAHAILDRQDQLIVSFRNDNESREVQANKFASNYLVPATFLRGIPQPRTWNQQKALEWANKLKVSTEVLAYALKRERLINSAIVDIIKGVRVPKRDKVDPEIPATLTPHSKQRKIHLLERGLSTYYVNLCFEGYRSGIASAARLAEMLLVETDAELRALASLYGEHLQYGS